MAKELVAMLLAGGQGSRLYALTQKLAKPAVPFGGKYRIIDFPLSNCVNSGIDTVGILTQYQPFVLNEYIGNGQHGILIDYMEECMYCHRIRRLQAQTGTREQPMRFIRILHLSRDMILSMLSYFQEIRFVSRTTAISLSSIRRKMLSFL